MTEKLRNNIILALTFGELFLIMTVTVVFGALFYIVQKDGQLDKSCIVIAIAFMVFGPLHRIPRLMRIILAADHVAAARRYG